ncbi:MAG: glycoside hydrolase family 2, partial [Bacteroidetes bacterium]|nr:glycoside hydrolase family 2 [Bacteroidota bacterium]
WDYHRMINTFRKYPKIAGWLYTEHHDVINEWNGYWRFDRSEKETGIDEIFPGMSLNDLHSMIYLSTGMDISKSVKGGEKIEIPLYLSIHSGEDHGKELTINYSLEITNYIGKTEKKLSDSFKVSYKPWSQKVLGTLHPTIPDVKGVALLKLSVSNSEGKVLHHNFMHFIIDTDTKLEDIDVIDIEAKDFAKATWSKKQWNVMEGKKVNGAGKGSFEYEFDIPKDIKMGGIKEVYFLVEASAKELFVKDMEEYDQDQNFMLGSQVANSSNPNSYPMSDETMFPSKINVSVNGVKTHSTTLPDDPADHRGVLSWHNQLEDGKLREAGSYGYLVKVPISKEVLKNARKNQSKIKITLSTSGEGGIAIYGEDFGRYKLNPEIVIKR